MFFCERILSGAINNSSENCITLLNRNLFCKGILVIGFWHFETNEETIRSELIIKQIPQSQNGTVLFKAPKLHRDSYHYTFKDLNHGQGFVKVTTR